MFNIDGVEPFSQTTVKVDRFILHSQNVRYKRKGNSVSSYTTKEYKDYKKLLSLQMGRLKKIDSKEDLFVTIHLNCINRVVGDLDNVVKAIYDAMEDCGALYNDRYVTHHYHSKSFGHKSNSAEIKIYKIKDLHKVKENS